MRGGMRTLYLSCGFLAVWLFGFSPLWGQDRMADTLVGLAEVIEQTSNDLKEVRKKLERVDGEGAGEEEAESLQRIEEELAGRLVETKYQFDELATGVAEEDFTGGPRDELNLGEEVKEILRPGIEELKELTKRPRETEELRSRQERLELQKEVARKALSALRSHEQLEGVEGVTSKRLQDLAEVWEAREKDVVSQLEALDLLLLQREEEGRSVLGPVSRAMGKFFRGRGLNLVKAFGALIGTWLLLRLIWKWVAKLPFLFKINKGEFAWRVVDISAYVLTALLAVVVSLLVLYFSGDWLLLTVFVVMMAGLGWTTKNTVPQVFEQGKMLLNLGPVRKGERLTFEGVPWEVGTIGLYTELSNCELTGGLIRVSLKRLSLLRSRPHDPREAWFPTKHDDWLMVQGSLGKVVMQTPEYVQVLRLGGARETFMTPDFLGMAPVNLSNNFRVVVRFGIDYRHQKIVTGKVLQILKAKIDQGIAEVLGGRELINSINVAFAEAAASSLDIDILADFKGGAAERFEKLQRAIQRICVDICNEQDWVIPFTQVTVSQADPGIDEEHALAAVAGTLE